MSALPLPSNIAITKFLGKEIRKEKEIKRFRLERRR